MPELSDLIDTLDALGVTVCWAQELRLPGFWAGSESLLILNASASRDDQAAACREVLSRLSVPSARPPLHPR